MERQTRKQKRKQAHVPAEKLNFELKQIEPLTANQKLAFESYEDGKNLLLHGLAGTGKTFISLYLALRQIMEGDGNYKQVLIVRSVVPTRDMGFLPGGPKEKAAVYEAPYQSICTDLFGRGDAYNYLKSKGLIDFISTSFVRGITINNTIIVVDEASNLTGHECNTIITRIGKNCRIIFSGDFRQSDFIHERDKKGFLDFIKILERMKSFAFIDFMEADVVRSGLVKEYLLTKSKMGIIL